MQWVRLSLERQSAVFQVARLATWSAIISRTSETATDLGYRPATPVSYMRPIVAKISFAHIC